MPLTDTNIRTNKPGPKPIKLSDGGGLFLLVMPGGSNCGASPIDLPDAKNHFRSARIQP